MEKKHINLEEQERKTVFQTPENYFDRLPSVIQQRIGTESVAKGWLPVAWVRAGVSLASVVVLVGAGFGFFRTYYSGSQPGVNISKVSEQEIIEYLQQSNVSQEELVEVAVREKLELRNSLLHDTPEESILEEMDEYSVEESI